MVLYLLRIVYGDDENGGGVVDDVVFIWSLY